MTDVTRYGAAPDAMHCQAAGRALTGTVRGRDHDHGIGLAAGVTGDPGAAGDPSGRRQRWRVSGGQPRVSKWDRPPAPKDWRYFVGGLGKVLITIGLLMFGFVAYQLWGTGIETARAQNRLEDQFDEIVAEATRRARPTTTDDHHGDDHHAARHHHRPTRCRPTDARPTRFRRTPTVARPRPPSTTVPAVEQDIPPIERGQALAKLEIPKIGKEGGDALYVVPGVAVDDLKKGPGHYPDTPAARPARQRRDRRSPHDLRRAVPQHRQARAGRRDQSSRCSPATCSCTRSTVDRDRQAVRLPRRLRQRPDGRQLTLTSCHPVFTARERIVVHAMLQPEQSAPRRQGDVLRARGRTRATTATTATSAIRHRCGALGRRAGGHAARRASTDDRH